MGSTTPFPMNFWSRIITDSSGTSPSFLYMLQHGDRATVSSGTQFVDQSTFDVALFTRGTSVSQVTGGVFGDSWIQFVGGTSSADNARIGWTHPGFSASTATSLRPAFQIEMFLYLTSLNSAGMYLWEITDDGHTDYAQSFIYQSTGEWRVALRFFRSALGQWMCHDWACVTMATGTLMHFACVRVDTGTAGPGGNRITIFQNGSQLPLSTGGFPSAHVGDWQDTVFSQPTAANRIMVGGSFVSAGNPATNPYNSFVGFMDEIRVLYDSYDGVGYTAATGTEASIWYFNVPVAPYSPADGTYSITNKVMALGSTALYPVSNGGLSLGNVSSTWLDLWSSGTAYLNKVGQNYTMVGTTRINFGTATVYLFSSTSGYLTLVAGTQIDLQANIGVSAKNFIFDTATGVKFGTTTNSKLAFFGSTPVVQQSGNIVTALATLGLITGGTIPSSTATVTTTSAAYTLTTANQYLICESGTSFAVTLPAAIGSYREFMVKNIGAGTVTLTANSADSIDANPTLAIAQWEKTRVFDYRIPNTTYLKLYLAMDGVDASTTFTDDSPIGRTMTAVGNAQIDTAQSVFGGASGLFDGTADFLTMSSTSDLNIGSNAFSFKLRTRLVNTTGNNMFCSRVTDANSYFYFGLEAATLRFRDYSSGNNFDITYAASLASATWYEFAAMGVAGSAGQVRLLIDGAIVATATIPAFLTRTTGLTIAAMTANASYVMNGWIDEFLFFNGVSLNTGSYTLATSAFASQGGLWATIV